MSKAAAAALGSAAQASGRSQHELLREAVDRYLGLDAPGSDRAPARAAGVVRPGQPFRDVVPTVRLTQGLQSLDLLEREER